jgi:hypothetical protein
MPNDTNQNKPPARRSLTPARPVAQIDSDGNVKFKARFVWGGLLLVILGAGGGSTAVERVINMIAPNLSTTSEAKAAVDKKQDDRLDAAEEQIGGLTASIGQIQGTQHWQVSEQAAERLCKKEETEDERNACEKRIIKWSLDKLSRPGATRPCTTISCVE